MEFKNNVSESDAEWHDARMGKSWEFLVSSRQFSGMEENDRLAVLLHLHFDLLFAFISVRQN